MLAVLVVSTVAPTLGLHVHRLGQAEIGLLFEFQELQRQELQVQLTLLLRRIPRCLPLPCANAPAENTETLVFVADHPADEAAHQLLQV
jgi:hypothetical protein